MRDCIIYGLVDPRTLFVRYVGKSVNGLARARAHRRPSGRAKDTYSANWVKSLKSAGLDYEIVVLDRCDSADNLSELERWWIAYGRASRWPLTNLTDGGEGLAGHAHTEDTRRKIGNANRGRKRSPEFREHMRDVAHSRSPETLVKIGHASAHRSQDVLDRISASLAGRHPSPETSAKISEALKGHPVSETTRKKIGDAQRGQSREPTTGFTGRRHSIDSRQKIGDALRGRKRGPYKKHNNSHS